MIGSNMRTQASMMGSYPMDNQSNYNQYQYRNSYAPENQLISKYESVLKSLNKEFGAALEK